MRALWLTFRDDVRALRWHNVDWTSCAVIALAGTVLLVHETFGFKIIMDEKGEVLEEPLLVNTWERDVRGEHSRAVVEAVDPESLDIDPLKYL